MPPSVGHIKPIFELIDDYYPDGQGGCTCYWCTTDDLLPYYITSAPWTTEDEDRWLKTGLVPPCGK